MAVFFLDTNVLFNRTFVEKMAVLCQSAGHRLCVSALAHTERVTQLRRTMGSNFNLGKVQLFIKTNAIDIVPFLEKDGEQVADQLATDFATDQDWQVAKWRRCAKCVRCDAEPPAQPRCPATIDWFIARHRTGEAVFLITEDKGEEFRGVRILRPEDALAQARGGSPA